MIVEEIGSFDLLQNDWNDLLECSGTKSIFQTFEWLSTWWEYFGNSKQLLLLAAREGEQLLGIAPLMVTRYIIKGTLPLFKVLQFIGTGLSDYLQFIIKSGYEGDVLNEFIRFLLKERKDWDIGKLAEVPQGSTTNEFLPEAFRTNNIQFIIEDHSKCPYIDLESSWEDYTTKLSRTTQKNMKMYSNRIRKAGKVEYTKIEDPCATDSAMDMFFMLHEGRWLREGDRGHIRSDQFKQFHKDAAHKLSRYVNLSFLKLNDKPISSMYCYNYDGTVHFYLHGFDMDNSHYSPGFLIVANQIKEAIQNGLNKFDFLRGDEPYKYHFTKTESISTQFVFSHSKYKLRLLSFIESVAKRKQREKE